MRESSTHDRAEPPATSEARRGGVGNPTPPSAGAIRALQVRAVGRAFLRSRPLVVLPVAAVNSLLLATSGAPVVQRMTLGLSIGTFVLLFFAERALLARRDVSTTWLLASLAVTLAAIAFGCALSGGVSSPLVPLLLAPTAITVAAFGRSRESAAVLTLAALCVLGLALAPDSSTFPPVPARVRPFMFFASTLGLVALCWAGIGGLVEAHARTAEVLERMRLSTLEEASSRMRATEQVGAKVAHELKNPLAAIQSLLSLLPRDALGERGEKRLDVALSEVKRMDEIVRDYLAFARPLSDLRCERVLLSTLAAETLAIVEARAERTGVELVLAAEDVVVEADARRLREALLNLLDNACRATPRGGSVHVRVQRAGRGARLTIADTGTGISDEVLARLGTPFVSTREDGTGLGLVLAKAAVAQHGGSLCFARRPEGGTMVTMLLPHEPGAPLEETA